MTDQAILYISTSFGVIGVVWAFAFIVYVSIKYNTKRYK